MGKFESWTSSDLMDWLAVGRAPTKVGLNWIDGLEVGGLCCRPAQEPRSKSTVDPEGLACQDAENCGLGELVRWRRKRWTV